MKNPLILVRHVLGAIDRIEQYTKGFDKNSFQINFLVQDGVIRNLEIIGEACRSISSDFKAKYPDVSWRKINDMRNKLIHEYFGVDLEIVWNVVIPDLPDLKVTMLNIVNTISD